MMRKIFSIGLFLFVSLASYSINSFAESESNTISQQENEYHLDSGDILKITVFSQEELSGNYTVSGNGLISLPLIGQINAKNATLEQLRERIIGKLKPDFLLDPKVSIEVLNYRPFYIMGEVSEPKSYPYVSGMTYMNAVAIAGGFTYRADKDFAYVKRAASPNKDEQKMRMDEKVMPGDVIRIDERFF